MVSAVSCEVDPTPVRRRADEEVELEKMVELIGRASERRLVDQAVVLDGGMQAKLAQARQRDQEKVSRSLFPPCR